MIIVILPSKNESNNIANITKVIDIGLSTYYPNINSLILNVDSSSSDNTAEIFKNTYTKTPKKNLLLSSGEAGKGFNLRAGIQYGIANGFKYFLTIDSDIISIEPCWISSYLERIISLSDDFVAPIYKRNRYEGNTTNHFSSPLFYMCFGVDIQQPIAGDFAFGRLLAKKILNAFEVESDYGYGVDTMMMWTAIASASKFSQIYLERKIHNPSFPKIVDMFSQVCLSTFYRINKFRENILEILELGNYCLPSLQQNIDFKYCWRPDNSQIEEIRQFAHKSAFRVLSSNKIFPKNTLVDVDVWLEQLSSEILILLTSDILNKADLILIKDRILPMYLLRVINYFDYIDCIDIKCMPRYWVEQKQKFLRIMRSRLLRVRRKIVYKVKKR